MMKTSTTLVLVLTAVILCVAAFFSVPPEAEPEVFSDQGGLFFPGLTDPYAAKEIAVYEPDPDTATVKCFNVRFEKGLWRIPSHHDYPADASKRMANATASLIGLRKDMIVSDSAEDRAALKVEDPLDDASSFTGRGKRIQLKDGSGRTLADIIVGKEVKGKPDWVYLREPGNKRIYAANLRPSKESYGGELLNKISTKFSDWIDTDLLHLTRSSAKGISLYDYSVDEETQTVKNMDRIDLVKGSDNKWTMEGLENTDSELKTSAVSEMLSTLDNLTIAGVRPTPEPLTTLSLMNKGFFLDDKGSLFGNEGHMEVRCDDGVVYYLFFGEVCYGSGETVTAGTGEGKAGEETSGKGGGKDGETKAGTGENRYLFVRVKVDPELEKPPAGVSAEEEGGKEEKDEKEAASTAKKEEEGAKSAGKKNDSGKDKTEKKDDEAEKKKKEAEKKKKEWQEKLDKARKRVDELNLRFAKWYYVIDDGSFRKLHKTRKDLLQPKLIDTSKIGEQPPKGRQPVRKPSGLAYFDIDYGSGAGAAKGDTVKVLYTGWLKDGTEFDKAGDRSAPFTFTLGEGSVIRGWEEGILGMRPGGKRKLIVPPELGYGAAGSGDKVPPDATLIFDVELIEAKKNKD